MAPADTITFRVVAGERPISPGNEKRPQQDSNLRSRLRRPPLQSSEFVRSGCPDSIAHRPAAQDHSAYIPDHGNCPVTACTVQGMARVRTGQAPAWPLSSDRSVRRGSRVKHDFACTSTEHFPPVLVVPAVTVMLEAGGAGTDTQRAIPGSEPCRVLCTFPVDVVVGQVAIITPGVRVLPGNGVWGVPNRVREGRRALRERGDNTGGAAPWDQGLGREPSEKGQLEPLTCRLQDCEVLSLYDEPLRPELAAVLGCWPARCSQLTEDVGDSSSPLLSGIVTVPGSCILSIRTLQGMACVRSGQAPAWPLHSHAAPEDRGGYRVKWGPKAHRRKPTRSALEVGGEGPHHQRVVLVRTESPVAGLRTQQREGPSWPRATMADQLL